MVDPTSIPSTANFQSFILQKALFSRHAIGWEGSPSWDGFRCRVDWGIDPVAKAGYRRYNWLLIGNGHAFLGEGYEISTNKQT